MIRFFKLILLAQLLISGGLNVYSQTTEELRKQADAYFEAGQFVQATPIYSKLLAQTPRDYDINFRYGTCLLYNSHNKEEAIRYLSYSVKGPDIDKRAFYYLGRAYHLNYQFNDAIIQYEKFKSVANPAQLKEFAVDRQITACKNGKKLLSNVTDMIVIQKTEIRYEDFYEIYKLNNIGGTILVTDEFQSKIDKQKGHRAVIHFPANSPGIYYSSYGEDGTTGLDIYVKKKLPDGKYAPAQKLQGGVNTEFDEDFAYMHPDGKYLYFCSKGHNSMGGYDVFRSAYNEQTNTFGPAENLDFAISSPDDDIFFVVDSLDRMAYFSSARESQDGKIFVYEVRVDRIPLQIAVIKGNFINAINASNKIVSIQIVDFSTGAVVGTFNSKETNGDYLITFPKPGKYKYLITVKGSEDTHVATIDIPYQKDFKPLKQRITVSRDDMGQEFVKVENLFDEEFDDPIAVMAEIYKEMSELMPNSDKYNLDSLDKVNKGNEVFTDAGLDPFVTKEDVEKVVADEIKDLNTAIAEDEKNAAIAYNLAEEKNDSANALMVEINKQIELAENTSDPTEKNRILTDVYEDTKKVDQLNNDAKDLVALGEIIDESIKEKKDDLIAADQVQQDLKNTPDGDKTALGNTIAENQNFFVENVKDNSPHENVVEDIINTNVAQANTAEKINNDLTNLRSEKNKLEAENTKLQNQLDNTSNKKERAGLEQQIRDNENRIEELKMQIDAKEKEYDLAIKSGTNSDLGNASQIVDNPSNATSTNIIALSDTEKNSIANKVETNSLDANLAEVNKILDENNIGGPALNLFASDETTKNYTLQQWNDAIDNEIDRLNVLKMNATGTEKEKIEQEIQRYEDLREEKIKQFDVVTDPAKIDPVINPNDVVTDFTTRQNEINKITDEGERHKQNLALNEDLKDELLAEKANLQKILDENPGSKNIEERIANVDKLIVQTDQKIAEDKKWLAENQGTVVVDTDKVVAIVDPGYQAKVNEIYKTSDPTERGNQMQILNESFAEKSNERIQELEASIKSNPNDAVAKAELDELKRLNSQISTDATQPLVKPVVLDVASVTSKVSPDQLIPDYTDRKTDISKITDPYDKKTAENNLNKELSAEIRDEIKELEQLQKDNPGNTEITGRINNLKKLDDELNASIVANDKWLAANPKADAVVVDDSDVKLINPDYQEKVDAINSTGNPDEQKAAIKELNEETVEKIDDRIEELDKTLAQNPGDKSAQEEKEELMQMKNQIEQNPDKSLTDPTDFSAINTKPSISEIMPDYQDKMNGINGSSQTTIDKEKDKIELNSDLVSLINSEIESLTEAKTTHPEAAKNIDKRIAGLNEIKTLKENEIKVSQDKIGGSTGTSGTLTIKDVMPDYEQKIAAIDKKNLEEKAELTEKNGVNNELIGKIDSRIDQLEKEKTANPSNAAQIDQKIQSLEDIKSQKQAEINANNERIQQLDGGTSATRPALTISSVMPDYDQKMAAIEKKNLDEKNDLTEKNAVNGQLISAIDSKIAQLENEKKANPSNAEAINKDIQTLENIKSQKQTEINLNNERIKQIESGDTSSRPVLTISSIMPDYDQKMAAIEKKNLDEKTELTEKNTVNNQLITAIDLKIDQLENEKNLNPANASAIDKDIQTLNTIKSQKQGEINLNNDRIKQLDGGTSSTRPAMNIAAVMPDYDQKMAAIDQKNLEEKNELTEKNALNNQLISAIDSKIAQLENEKKNNPANADAINKDIQTLQNIKSQKQGEINANNDRIKQLDGGTSSSRPAMNIAAVMPDYDQKMAAIEQKNLDEKNELTEKNALNNQLISAIDSKIAQLENEKKSNLANADAINKDIQTLQNIKSQKQGEINANNERIKQLDGGVTATRSAITISSIMPDYDQKMAAIEKKNLDEKNDLTEKNGVNNQLISAIDSKIAQLENEKQNNPSNAAGIDKDIQTLEGIKAQKQTEINLNNERIKQLESGDTSSRPVLTISSIMPDYDQKMAAIEKKNLDEKNELTEKNGVNNQLISAIDKKIAELENEKKNNPANAAEIDKDIQTLQTLKSQKQSEINLNNDRIKQLDSGSTTSRPAITLNSLMPDYETKMNQIDAGTASEKEKLTEKNKLNQQLINAIDAKIAQLENEKKSNPSQAAAIQQDIDKLNELKESKRAEIDKNNQLLASMGDTTASVKTVEDITTDDYTSEDGKNMIESHSQDIAEIKELQNDINNLENELANTSDPKSQVKIEKQIDKKETTQAKIENEILEDLGDVNQAEFKTYKDATVVNADLASANNPNDPSIDEANANIAEANRLMDEAAKLRDEAANEKDPVVANQKLNQAFENEQRANNLLDQANLTYKTAAVIDQMNGNENEIITSVPENESDRKSTELMNQANALDLKANELNAQAQHLRDSSLTVKKKFREALVVEADRLDSLANIYRAEAADIKTEANDLKSQENAIADVLPEQTNKTVDKETQNDVASTSDYKNYYDAKTIGDSNMFRAEELGLDIASLEEKKERKIKEAIVTYGTGPELTKALSADPEFQDIEHDLDSLKNLQQQYRDKAIASYEQAESILEKTGDAEMEENMLAMSQRDIAPIEKIVVTVNPIDADFTPPVALNSSIFRTTNNVAVYSNEKPIPVDQQQPSGLVYKVQVGAFRKPLPPEYFNKFAPISGQKIGDGITRYMVGYFTNFNVADNSKEQVHDLGYNDAFVVAYCNGERISIQEAKEIEAGRKQCPGTNMIAVNNMTINQTTTTTVNNQGNTTNTTQGGTTSTTDPIVKPNTEEEKQLTSYYTNVPDAAKANQVEIMKGLFFTVQIGVYSKPVKASLLYNIQPLNSQLTEDNKIRYTTGVYCDINEAIKRKDEIVTIGITDAFVTAYYNGKRIPITEANQLLAANGPSILFDCQGTNNQVAGNQTNNQGGNQTNNQGGNQTNNQGGNQTNNQGGNQTNNQGGNQTNNQGGNQTNNQGGNQTNNQGGNQTNNQGGNQTNNQGGNQTNNQGGNQTNNQGGNQTNNQGGNQTNNQGGNQTNNQGINTNVKNYAPDDTAGLWRVQVGFFKDQVPDDFISLLLDNQDEGIVSASDGDENITFYTIPYTSRSEAEERSVDLYKKGFKDSQIEKMPDDVDELGNVIYKPAVPKEVFYKEGVHYRIVVGKYQNEIPGEYATIILQTENLLETEVDADGYTYVISTKIQDMATVKERLVELYELGIEDMDIVTYYKYDAIPFEQGEAILQEKPIEKLDYYPTPEGISADSYLYVKEAVYFRIDLGKFNEDVPQEFANLLFENSDENILREETFEGETYFYTENIRSYEEAEATLNRLKQKGFTDAKLVAFHKYDDISVKKAREILAQP